MAEMAARCEDLYDVDLMAAVTAYGPVQVLRMGVEAMADRHAGGRPLFAEAVDLLAETLHEPALEQGRFRSDHLEQERENLVRGIASLADDRGLVAWRGMIETMHKGSPLALHSWGDLERAAALDERRVHLAWEGVTGSAPVRLALVGDLTEEQALEAALRLGGPGQRERPAAPARPPNLPAGPVREVRVTQPLAQSQLVLGFRVALDVLPGPACALATSVLGGGSHGRLFKRVREAEGLAYGCGASLLVDSATLAVQAGINGHAAGRVQEIVLDELARLARGQLELAELEVARSALLRRLDEILDSPRDVLSYRLAGLALGRESDPARAAELLRETSVEQVVRAVAGMELDTVFLLEGTRA